MCETNSEIDTVSGSEESCDVNAELLEAHIVAQAITELQEVQAPAGKVSTYRKNSCWGPLSVRVRLGLEQEIAPLAVNLSEAIKALL